MAFGTTAHHVPPKHPDEKPRLILRKTNKHEKAHKLLFGEAESFEEAAAILKKDWWTPPRPGITQFILRKKSKYHRAYTTLFGAAKSYEDAETILRHITVERRPGKPPGASLAP